MKVNGSPSASPTAGRTAGRPVADGFAPATEEAGSAATTTRAFSAGPVGSLEALLALQETSSPLERRRKAVRRAGRILDALDDLRVAVLDPEGLDGVALQRLQGAVREARAETGDGVLEDVLEEIEVRAAVEMAKRETRAEA
ncbi:flagellar assembly protein FliX [Caulobacter sp. S45]|uniref:flagellar assembly protein FliX n=1 Tax=Caulobacter sp. S45 TaxID=1641861 RepID=UPI0015773AE8|nr:flagellar assembly protein FliX [Caulobacter sp. S45]